MTIYTGDLPKAGTDSNVTLKFFGSKSSSSDIFIEKIENRFDRASADNLHIELEDIGSLKKVRVTIDAKGSRKEWFLDKIEMTNILSKKQYLFKCDEWLSKNREGSRGLSIDVPLYKDGHETINTTDYKISVKTSDVSGAGTDANVFVILFGEHGDSGEIRLDKSETNMNKFERKRTDVFTFKKILSLGELTKLRVWHDDSGSLIGHASWHLESIKVEDLSTGRTYMFNCNKWLSLSKDDKQIVRELKVEDNGGPGGSTPRIGDKVTYEVSIMTADERSAGTKQNAFIVLVGENGEETKPKLLQNTIENKIFRRGQTDEFKINSKSLGNLKRIVLGHVSREDDPPRTREERNAAWACYEVQVKDTSTGITYVFPIREPLILDRDPQVIKCSNKKEGIVAKTKALENIKYEVVVYTGSERGGGTNAKVYITIFGKNGDTGKRLLNKSFEKDHVDKFAIESLDLGPLRKVHIEHDNSSFTKNNWFLDKIEIVNMATKETTVFPCNRWLSKEKEDGEIGRDLFPEVSEERRSYDGSTKSPRNSFRESSRIDDQLVTRSNSFNNNKRFEDYDDRPIKSREWERPGSMREPNIRDRDFNRERDMFRSPRRNNF